MHILLTGASGRVGRHVARELLRHGHQIRAFDSSPLPQNLRGEAEMIYGDITDRFAVLHAAAGCEAIIHMAAIPDPMHGETAIFPINVGGTQHVFAAAEGHGISRVVLASSCSAFGFAFAREPFDPEYLPVDEDHPSRPQDLYGLSKLLNEEMARTYARRGVHSICWRYPEAMDFTGPRQDWYRRRLKGFPSHRSNDFWAYVTMQDIARAFRLAAESDVTGSHVLLATARDSFVSCDVREALAQYFPLISGMAADLAPDAALYSSARAKELLGFQAEMSWRDVPQIAPENRVVE